MTDDPNRARSSTPPDGSAAPPVWQRPTEPVDQPRGVDPAWQPPSGPGWQQPVSTIAAGVSSPAKRSWGPGLVGMMLGVAIVFAVGGVAFAAGRLTAQPTAGNGTQGGTTPGAGSGNAGQGFGNGFGRGNGNGAGNGGGAGAFGGLGGAAASGSLTISGTVTAVAADHITIQLPGGQTVDVPVDSATTYHRQSGAGASDVKAGATVDVALSGRFGRGGPGASGAPGGASGAPGSSPVPNASGGTSTGRALPPASDVTIAGG
ncbi:MAG TPA: hypothetical protein VFI28_10325 [Candidatus Limnocylindrales bacterium]|nr:hypothetical protein [Candidatus Limnocylindrales bacterium]